MGELREVLLPVTPCIQVPKPAVHKGVATGVYIGIYTPKISPSKLFMG